MRLIFLGAPGAGKGTQSARVGEKLEIPTISTGNLLRQEIAAETAYGKQVKHLMENGELVSDEIVEHILKERLKAPDCSKGCILDGFPRNVGQAEALDAMGIQVDLAISIEVPDEEIIARLAGRRTCLACGATFHVFNAPSKTGEVCDVCGEVLVRRPDDEPETIATRLKNFHANTEPLKAFYDKKGILALVDSSSIGMTLERIMKVIDEANG